MKGITRTTLKKPLVKLAEVINKTNLFLIILVFGAISASLIFYPQNDDSLNIYFLDVGQGDSILIQTKNNKKILIDGGKDKFVLEGLSRNLKSFDKKIDYIIGTHSDNDHLGGLLSVVANYDIGKVIVNPPADPKDKDYTKLIKALQDKSIPYHEAYSGDALELDGLKIHFLWPDELGIQSIQDENERSITTLIKYEEFEIFSAGDLNKEGEEDIFNYWAGLDTEILKLGHHGSKTSTSEILLDKLTPEIAIVSAGKDNRYNHPSPEVIDLLKAKEIKVYETLGKGDVRVRTDGEGFEIY